MQEFLPVFLDFYRTEHKSPATTRNYNQHMTTYVIPVLGDRPPGAERRGHPRGRSTPTPRGAPR